MAKYNKHEPNLFDEKVEAIKFSYPVVIFYDLGEEEAIEVFYENGVRNYVKAKPDSMVYHKQKWRPRFENSYDEESSKKEYEYYIKRLIIIHGESTQEKFNEIAENLSKFDEEIELIKFSDLLNNKKQDERRKEESKEYEF
jgi:hypothetical protein